MRTISKPPSILLSLFSSLTWRIPCSTKSIFLTFDDGPHPEATPRILSILAEYKAKATFFCLGKNVERFPLIYKQILDEGHAVGNHSYSHPDGWKTATGAYIEDVHRASMLIPSTLFRPPYGRITPPQLNALKSKFQIIMWSALAKDYDHSVRESDIITEICTLTPGTILALHDNEKSQNRTPAILSSLLKKRRDLSYEIINAEHLFKNGSKNRK